MDVFFENLEKGLLFITIILIIGFSLFTIFGTVMQATEQVKSSATSFRIQDNLPSAGVGFVTFSVAQEIPLILAAHE